MLCSRCTAVFQNSKCFFSSLHLQQLDDYHLQILHPNFGSFEAALKEGCGFCHRLSHALISKRNSRILSDLGLCSDVDPESFSLRYRFAYESDNGKIASCLAAWLAQSAGEELREHCTEYLVFSPEQAPLTGEPTIRTGNGITTAPSNTIASWAENCNKNHPLCSREGIARLDHRFARVLDVGDVPDAPEVKLCLSENLDLEIKYVTLSHCWGGIASEVPYLTTETYNEYLQCIAIANLPRAFQDAVQLTRKLGIRYLWTDSLCIIQDSPKDWLDQAAVMGEVYQGSYLNISPDTSVDPNGGLFTLRNSILATPLRISIRGEIPQDDLPPLRLESTSMLVAEATQALETELNLNTCLGNNDGNFDLKNKDFAWSARNVELIDSTIYAELRSIYGEWKYRSVGVRELLKGPFDRSSFKLVGDSTLIITASPSTDCLDLNECLANRNGAFSTDGTNFALTARNISLDGSTLHAELRKINGEWRQDSIDLASFVSWSSSQLRATKLGEIFYDVGTDSTKWPGQASRSKSYTKEWVFQESLLAPGVVHFTDRQLIWECTTSKALEERLDKERDVRQALVNRTEPDSKTWDPYSVDLHHEPKTRELGLDYTWSSVKAMYGRENTLRKKGLAQDPDLLRQAKHMCYGENDFESTHPLIKYWSDIVVTYSAAHPRQVEDRLIAVAGLAEILSARTGLRYVAGLWTIHLPRQLLWTPSHSNKMCTEEYTAPSWSWASYPGAITNSGIELDPILETNGAMDLIKILSIDMEGVAEKDDMPFGRVKDGRLLLRGRLLPIALDLNAWPEGATRENALVQFWTGSTPEAPSGETFLVPILFTCPDERLPDTTPNSLLLESTEEKGVFRRIGTARLSSSDLSSITPQLYKVDYADHDEDEDLGDEECAEDDGLVIIPAASQEVSNNAASHRASNDTQYTFLDGACEIATEPETAPDNERRMTPEQIISSTEREISRWNTLFPQPSKPVEESDGADELKREMGFLYDPVAKRSKAGEQTRSTPRKKVQKLAPKDAIASHYYIGYIEDDRDVVRYGHFVFEIR